MYLYFKDITKFYYYFHYNLKINNAEASKTKDQNFLGCNLIEIENATLI